MGDLELRFQPASVLATPLAGTVTIVFYEADQVSGVRLFLPADLQPGTYPIGDLFRLAEADVIARFDHNDAATGNSFWESTEGTLVLTQTGASLSGSFTFTAVSTPDGSKSVTVVGNFEGVSLGP